MDTRQPVKIHLRRVSSSITGGILQILEKNARLHNSAYPTKRKTIIFGVWTHIFSYKLQHTPCTTGFNKYSKATGHQSRRVLRITTSPSVFSWEATQSCDWLLQMFSGQKVPGFACLSQHLVDFNTNSYSEKPVKSDLYEKLCSH